MPTTLVPSLATLRGPEEETHVMGTTSNHKKKALKAHKQFIRILCPHNKVTQALAMYDCTYNFQFYRLFQGKKTTTKKCPEQHHGALDATFLSSPR
jgi:hypothetical protein